MELSRLYLEPICPGCYVASAVIAPSPNQTEDSVPMFSAHASTSSFSSTLVNDARWRFGEHEKSEKLKAQLRATLAS